MVLNTERSRFKRTESASTNLPRSISIAKIHRRLVKETSLLPLSRCSPAPCAFSLAYCSEVMQVHLGSPSPPPADPAPTIDLDRDGLAGVDLELCFIPLPRSLEWSRVPS